MKEAKVKTKTKFKLDAELRSPDESLGRVSTRSHTAAPVGTKAKRRQFSIDVPHVDVHGPVNMPDMRDSVSDAEARVHAAGAPSFKQGRCLRDVVPEPREPTTLPAVSGKTVFHKQGVPHQETPDPEWIETRHLPNYQHEGIRRMARDLFSNFTKTPLEKIEMISTVTHPHSQVNKVASWISRNGIRDQHTTDLDLSRMHPAFNAQLQVWNTKTHGYMMSRDAAGHHIYRWPGGRGVHVEQNPKKLIK